MNTLDLGPHVEPPAGSQSGRRRAASLCAASLVTLAAFSLAFVLGAAYFDSRRFSAHVTRLQRMQAQSPNVEQVTQGLLDDGSPLVLTPRDETELRAWVTGVDVARRDELLDQWRRFPLARVYRAADMFYVIFFDAQGTMRDFACLSA